MMYRDAWNANLHFIEMEIADIQLTSFSTIYAANGTVNTSDRRLKTNIQDSDLGLDFIRTLRPVSYNWKSGDKDLHYGLIAQEAEEAIQAAHKTAGRKPANIIVDHDKKTDRYGVRYTELIAPIIKSIQDLFAQVVGVKSDVETLKSDLASKTQEIEKLKSENAEMKARLDRIEKALAK